MFEPEHEFQTKEGHLICDKYLSKESITSSQKKYINRVLNNRVDSDWIGQISNRRFKMHLWPFLPKKYIIKFVRCNLGVSFLNSFYDIPVLFFIRNPYDVVFSQNRVKFSWLYDLTHFKKQEHLTRILEHKYSFQWKELDSFNDIEILTLRWCIENKVIFDLSPTNQNNFIVLHYEELKADINIYYDLCKTLNIKPLSNIEDVYSKPSSKTHPKSYIRDNDKDSKHEYDIDTMAIKGILDRFKVTAYTKN